MLNTKYELTFDEVAITLGSYFMALETNADFQLQLSESVEAKLKTRCGVPESKKIHSASGDIYNDWTNADGTVYVGVKEGDYTIYEGTLTETERKYCLVRAMELGAKQLQASAAKIRKECGLPAE